MPPPPTRPQLDQAEIAARLRLSATRLARILRQQADLGLTAVAAHRPRHRSPARGRSTLGALADTEHVTPPTITKVVEKLEAHGPDRAPHRRRRPPAHASPPSPRPASDLLAEGRARKDAILATRIAQLDPDQLARLAAALDVLDVLAGTERREDRALRASPTTRSAR